MRACACVVRVGHTHTHTHQNTHKDTQFFHAKYTQIITNDDVKKRLDVKHETDDADITTSLQVKIRHTHYQIDTDQGYGELLSASNQLIV